MDLTDTYVVAKPFNATLRRFRAGDVVTPVDDFSPHAFEDLRKRRFLASGETKAAEKALDAVDAVEPTAEAHPEPSPVAIKRR